MSAVLYALGFALLVWGAYVLVSGDMIATLDIAAGLVASGAVVIGIGAVTGAIGRLSRIVAEAAEGRVPLDHVDRRPPPPPPGPARPARRPVAAPPVDPVFEPNFAGSERPLEREPDRAPEPVVALAQPEPEVVHPATPEPDPDPDPAPALEPSAQQEPAPPSRQERRRIRALAEASARPREEPEIESPPVVAPILGGGFAYLSVGETPPAEPEAADNEPRVPPSPAVQIPDPDPREAEPQTASEPAADEPTAVPESKSDPAPAPALSTPTEPRVPEWLARARARREARAKAETGRAPAGHATAKDEPTEPPLSAVEMESSSIESIEGHAEAVEPAEPEVVREGEHNGVYYRFFADGSIEARSEHGVRRFGSLDELRATVLAARGHLGEDLADEIPPPEPASASEPGKVAPARMADDFEAALAELEGRSQPRDR